MLLLCERNDFMEEVEGGRGGGDGMTPKICCCATRLRYLLLNMPQLCSYFLEEGDVMFATIL